METRSIFIISAMLIVAYSCTEDGLEGVSGRNQSTSSHGRYPGGDTENGTDNSKRPTVYMSGVRYPEVYDWRHGTEEAEHVVFLLGDGEPLFESTSAPAEADTRHISNGRLFHTVTVGDSTVVFANGERQFAYRAQEMTAALEDDGKGHIMTLGEPRSTDESFTYRLNGSPKLKRKGVLIGPELENAIFHYRNEKGLFIMVENGVEKEKTEPAAEGIIVSTISMGGRTYAYEKVGPYILVQSEGKGVHLALPDSQYHSLRLEDWFFHDGSGFLTFVSGIDCKEIPGAVIFRNEREIRRFEWYEFYNILSDGHRLAYILKSYGREEYAVALGEDAPETLPEGFVPHSKRAMDFTSGTLRLALDTPEGPVIWQNGVMSRFAFNGYIDNIVVK